MLQKCSKEKVLDVFFKEPTKVHSLKDISLKANLAHTSVKKLLVELLKANLILEKIEKRGKRKFPIYFSNLEGIYFKKLKQVSNLRELYESDLAKKINESLMPKSIILFGSYSGGEDIEESDIDIFVESSEKEIPLKVFEKKLARKINLLFNEDLKNLNKNLKENVLNGIILEGVIDL